MKKIIALLLFLLISTPAFASYTPTNPTPTQVAEVVTWGDSLTFGYTPVLASLLSPYTVVNNGISGQNQAQIAVRQGALSTSFTSTGGSICSPGGDVVTLTTDYEPLTANGPIGGVTGSVAGNHGTLTLATGVYTFTCDVTGAQSLASTTAFPFTIDQNYRNAATQLFWIGHNNNKFTQANNWNTQTSLAANVTPNSQFAFLSNTYDNGTAGALPSGIFGTTITQNNNFSLRTFGASHYIDILTPLAAAANASWPVDATDTTNGISPTSVRAITGCGTITGTINSVVTSVPLSIGTSGCTGSGGTIAVGDVLVVGQGAASEGMTVTAVTGSSGAVTATVTRGWSGTAASHTSGDVAYSTDYIHFGSTLSGNPCIASAASWWHSTYPSAQQSCGYNIIAATVQTFLAANPPPIAKAPVLGSSADGLFQPTPGLVGSTVNQTSVGTIQNPVQVTASNLNMPGIATIGSGLAQFTNLGATNAITVGPQNNSSAGSIVIGNISGTNYIIPQGGQSVTLGNSSNPFNSADIGKVSFFNFTFNPDTADVGSVGITSKPFGKTYSDAYVETGTKFTTAGTACGTLGATAGNATGGSVVTGTNATCSLVIVMGGGTNGTVPTFWNCWAQDSTTPTTTFAQTAQSTTSATFTSSAPVAADTVRFECTGHQ